MKTKIMKNLKFLIALLVFSASCGLSAATENRVPASAAGTEIQSSDSCLPFKKSDIREIRIRYWIRVRDAGTYDGIYDEGIRERMLIVRTIRIVDRLLNSLQIKSCEPCEARIVDDIVFVGKNGKTWGATTWNWGKNWGRWKEMKLKFACGKILTLADATCGLTFLMPPTLAEKELRGTYVDFMSIALNKKDAYNLRITEYNPAVDGTSHEHRVPAIVEELILPDEK